MLCTFGGSLRHGGRGARTVRMFGVVARNLHDKGIRMMAHHWREAAVGNGQPMSVSGNRQRSPVGPCSVDVLAHGVQQVFV